MPLACRARNWGARLREVSWAGSDTVVLENELLRVAIAVGRGTDVLEFLHKPTDCDLVWLTADGVRDQETLNAISRGGDGLAAFLDRYAGGWQEILPNGGSPSRVVGAAFAQHAEVCLLPWNYRVVSDREEAVEIEVSVSCVRTPLTVRKTLRLEQGSPKLEITEQLANTSPVEIRFMWGHHLAFGRPFLRPGARLSLPDGVEGLPDQTLPGERRVAITPFSWPQAVTSAGAAVDLSIIPPPGTPTEMIYLQGFPNPAWYQIHSGDVTLRVEWNSAVMPYLWFWQEFGQTRDYPWYGRHWNIGLEPFSSYPTAGLEDAIKNGTAASLAGHGTLDFWLSAEVQQA